ncbi:SHOCT domain-containing protein [Pontibacter pudoricolor]|uniref:SHOCT domain-containing protein n=1 Tax=Pontibacter pudoricolor TaxID=2694930 RepID=UPI00192EF3E0
MKTTPKTQPRSATKATSGGSIENELKKLKSLLDEGAITQQEYEIAKKKVLNQ